MNNIKTYITLLSACLLFNCKQADKVKVSITETGKHSQNFGIAPNETITPTKLVSFKNITYYYFFNYKEQNLLCYELKSNNLIYKIDASSIGYLMSFDRTTQVQWLEKSLIGFFSNDDQKLITIDLEGKIIHNVTTSNEETTQPYVTVSYFDRTFGYNNNTVYFNKAYTDFVLSEKKDYIKYYSRPVSLSIDLDNNSKHHFLKAPQAYQEGNSYKDFDVYNCSGSNNQIVFSFPSNDSLFICENNQLVKKVYAGSIEKPKFEPYDVSKNKDLSEFRKYSSTKPFYQKIIYDPYREFYYRVFKLKNNYLDKDGKINREYNWSLIVLNNNFKIIGEITFNSKNHSPATVHPTKEGLIVGEKTKKGITKTYTFFEFKIDNE